MSAPTVSDVIRTDDGAKLAVSVTGQVGGPTVVLSHGWAAGRGIWNYVVALLVAEGLSVVTYDQRGNGESTLGVSPIGIARLALDLEAVLASVDAQDAVVAGHSGGGFAAMSHAITNSSRLRGLVLLGTAAHDRNVPKSEVKQMGNPLVALLLKIPPLGRKLIGSTVGPGISAEALEAHRALFAGTARQVRSAYFGCSQGMDLRSGLAEVKVPATVLHGDADHVIKPELGRTVAETLPNARFEEVQGAGHMLPLEAPDRVARAIVELTGQ
ncbi:non-heme chloroperoxidase [Kibdelosporangium banguiense]|uniref:Non-heme chloroperoxidase n=1 Tax=Kibdelosporangium banguiense TaxID=1365924 RepID=A0ABS4TK96_9PSEU|nr:alpha/beta hydrolase [Kibdelosporangium banguiense]MBP2324323.1 non-heme chloroperoxidase [Kibdelosporangium banguiense]